MEQFIQPRPADYWTLLSDRKQARIHEPWIGFRSRQHYKEISLMIQLLPSEADTINRGFPSNIIEMK